MSRLKCIGDGKYTYLGVGIVLNDRLPIGNPGRWSTEEGIHSEAYGILVDVTKSIDARLLEWETALGKELIIRVGIQLPEFLVVIGNEGLLQLFTEYKDVEAAVSSIDFDDPKFDHLFPPMYE